MRFILYLLATLLLISIVRSVIGILAKGVANAIKDANSPKDGAPAQSKLGGDLHRDPVCGTFVAESTPYQRRLTGQVYYYCSNTCKEKHALVAK